MDNIEAVTKRINEFLQDFDNETHQYPTGILARQIDDYYRQLFGQTTTGILAGDVSQGDKDICFGECIKPLGVDCKEWLKSHQKPGFCPLEQKPSESRLLTIDEFEHLRNRLVSNRSVPAVTENVLGICILQRDLTASIIRQECQARVEGIKREIEKIGMDKGFYHLLPKALWKEEGIFNG